MKRNNSHLGNPLRVWQNSLNLGRILRQSLPLHVLLLLCLNLLIAPAVYAAVGGGITRQAAWMLGVLGLVTLGLSVYLFWVIFQPERF